MIRIALSLCLSASLTLVGCPGPSSPGDAARADADASVSLPDVRDSTHDVPGYDAGPMPPCEIQQSYRHLLDRPGGDREADPSAFVEVAGGYLVGLRRVDLAPPDGGVVDGGSIPVARDSVDILPLGPDGALRTATPVTLADGAAERVSLDAPAVVPTASGALVVFQRSRGNAADADFLLDLRATLVDSLGIGPAPTLLRDRYARPVMARLGDGQLLGVSFRFESSTEGGIVAARPFSILLREDGTDARPRDVDINGWIPGDAYDPHMRPTESGGALYVIRTNGRIAFLRFDAAGQLDTRGVYEVRGASVPVLDDVVSVGDGLVAVWSRQQAGGRTEVHVVVASDRGELRLDREIESFTGEGPTAASVVRAYGGAAVLWRRGVDSAARVRVAVIAPDGTVRVEPTDLIAAPSASGRVLAVARGRELTFLVRDGRAPAWGYAFGRACLPGG